jgi:hypothetical protein
MSFHIPVPSSITHHPSQQSSHTQASPDQLAAVATFLDELEAKAPLNHFQKETDGSKTLLDTINSLIAVVRITALFKNPLSLSLS